MQFKMPHLIYLLSTFTQNSSFPFKQAVLHKKMILSPNMFNSVMEFIIAYFLYLNMNSYVLTLVTVRNDKTNWLISELSTCLSFQE